MVLANQNGLYNLFSVYILQPSRISNPYGVAHSGHAANEDEALQLLIDFGMHVPTEPQKMSPETTLPKNNSTSDLPVMDTTPQPVHPVHSDGDLASTVMDPIHVQQKSDSLPQPCIPQPAPRSKPVRSAPPVPASRPSRTLPEAIAVNNVEDRQTPPPVPVGRPNRPLTPVNGNTERGSTPPPAVPQTRPIRPLTVAVEELSANPPVPQSRPGRPLSVAVQGTQPPVPSSRPMKPISVLQETTTDSPSLPPPPLPQSRPNRPLTSTSQGTEKSDWIKFDDNDSFSSNSGTESPATVGVLPPPLLPTVSPTMLTPQSVSPVSTGSPATPPPLTGSAPPPLPSRPKVMPALDSAIFQGSIPVAPPRSKKSPSSP
uniref:Vegetative cell wall protein gp1-like n=1 Tax=Saccoglossus kowalevskii TaxID=10224 RepID=A0ABM0LYW6_SACKO|nr:PREDICTED: vegetative cell wall protein gp1-like [Saccoglossus kowalevskii]